MENDRALVYNHMKFVNYNSEFVQRAREIDEEIEEEIKSKHLRWMIGAFGFSFIDSLVYKFAEISSISLSGICLSLACLSISIAIYNTGVLFNSTLHRRVFLKKRHEKLQIKELEKYIVYLNLLTVMTPGYEILIEDGMFKVRGKLGTWKFKEINISKDLTLNNDRKDKRKLVLDVENLNLYEE